MHRGVFVTIVSPHIKKSHWRPLSGHCWYVTALKTISIPALAVPLYCEVLISIFYSVKRRISFVLRSVILLIKHIKFNCFLLDYFLCYVLQTFCFGQPAKVGCRIVWLLMFPSCVLVLHLNHHSLQFSNRSGACPDLGQARPCLRTVVCCHWLRDLCMKGAACEFLHQYDLSKMLLC